MARAASPGFFVLRTPALSWSEIEALSGGLDAARAIDDDEGLERAIRHDTSVVRSRLRALLQRRDVRAAIELASPSLSARLGPWLRGEDSEAALAVEPALVRYVMRMAGRATPFGLFAGWTSGRVDARTCLEVPPRSGHRRRTRLDADYLFALAEELSNDPSVRAHLRYRANDTACESGGRLRYWATHAGEAGRTYQLLDVAPTPYHRAALSLARAPEGATPREIADALVAAFDGVDPEDAARFVAGLIDIRMLCSPLHPAVTGVQPAERLLEQIEAIPSARAASDRLRAALADLAAVDAGDGLESVSSYSTIAERLPTPATEFGPRRRLHVDLRKPCENVTLGRAIAEEGARAIDLLAGMGGDSESDMDRFARAFEERYQGRAVPLLEALDPESGIGFPPSPAADPSPLLAGLALEPAADSDVRWGARERLLLAKLTDALRRGATEIALSDDDVVGLSRPARKPLAAGFGAMMTIAATSADAVARRDYRLYVEGAAGTNSALYLGRFLHDDPALAAWTREALRAEADQDPDAMHAEIAHFPHGTAAGTPGNVVSRPCLRDYEIPVAGGSGAPVERQIPPAHLLVSVRNGVVRLHSQLNGKRVVPHLACAHNFRLPGLPLYRFLAELQEHGVATRVRWSWGPLEGAPFLPRVTHGRLVLSLARWNVPSTRLKALAKLSPVDRFRGVQGLRAELGLPRHVRWIEAPGSDNALPVDLENVLSIDSLLTLSMKASSVLITENFPEIDELVARGVEGTFHHELIVPYVRATREQGAAPRLAAVRPLAPSPDRQVWPGEEWMFVKLHCGMATADRLLVDLIAPLLRELREDGGVNRWYFIRYADPGWHLRIRLRGNPERLWREVAPRVYAAVSRARAMVQKLAVDTYDPEVQRYGGDEGMVLAEELFDADSDAAVRVVEHFRTDSSCRWRVALLGMNALLDDLGCTLEDKRSIVDLARAGQAHRFPSSRLTSQLGEKFRGVRGELESLLADPPRELAAGVAAIRARSAVVTTVGHRLRDLERDGRLVRPICDLATSYLHMWANRVFRGSANAQEFVLYDFLTRIYQGRLARGRAVQPRAAS